jgi:hypothetical protein
MSQKIENWELKQIRPWVYLETQGRLPGRLGIVSYVKGLSYIKRANASHPKIMQQKITLLQTCDSVVQ